MRPVWLTVIGFLVLGGEALAQARGIRRLAWLQGCWESDSTDRAIEEHWMAPRGNAMVGVSRTVRGEALTEYELVIIREQGEQLAYEAHPSGQPAAVFWSRSISDSTVLFENPQHDFPQRIGYERTGPAALLAWIEGNHQGRVRRIDFSYRRAPCPGD